MGSKRLKRYRLYGTVTASTYIGTVEAYSKKEAEEKGLSEAWVSVCHQCANKIRIAKESR